MPDLETPTTESSAATTVEENSIAPIPEISDPPETPAATERPTDAEAAKKWDTDRAKANQDAANKRKADAAERERKRDEENADLRRQLGESHAALMKLVAPKQGNDAQAPTELELVRADLELAEKIARGDSDVPETETRSALEISTSATRKLLELQSKRDQEDARKKQEEEAQRTRNAELTAAEKQGWDKFQTANPDIELKKAIEARDQLWTELASDPDVVRAKREEGDKAAYAVQKALLNRAFPAKIAELKKAPPKTAPRTGSQAPPGSAVVAADNGAAPEPVQMKEVGNRFAKYLGL